MPLTKEQVAHLSRLARVTLSDKETAQFTHELSLILDYFSRLAEVDTSDVEPRPQKLEPENIFRDDSIGESLDRDAALKNAPDTDGHYFRVPRVIDKWRKK